MARDPLIVGRIPPSLEARINAECARTGASKSELLREALTGYLSAGDPTPHPAPRIAARGRTRSPTPCPHRIRSGAYCKRCERVVA